MMQAPNPILIYRAGVKNLLDFAILWHVALCGLTGARLCDLVRETGANENTVRGSLARQAGMKLLVAIPNRDLPGSPICWVCSRIGYRLMTGHLKAEEKVGGQLPLGSEIVHAV